MTFALCFDFLNLTKFSALLESLTIAVFIKKLLEVSFSPREIAFNYLFMEIRFRSNEIFCSPSYGETKISFDRRATPFLFSSLRRRPHGA